MCMVAAHAPGNLEDGSVWHGHSHIVLDDGNIAKEAGIYGDETLIEMLAVKPKVIISLGNTPTKALLNTKKSITQMRGEFYDFNGIKLIPTFNPAYLLRDPTKKREVWEDMKKVRAFLAENI